MKAIDARMLIIVVVALALPSSAPASNSADPASPIEKAATVKSEPAEARAPADEADVAAKEAIQKDALVTTRAKIALLTAPLVDGRGLFVDTVDGVVTVYGSVGSEAERDRAAEILRGVRGVVHVDNAIRVLDEAVAPRVSLSAEKLGENVRAALEDEAIENVSVASVEEGTVTLEGRTSTLSEHRHALTVVRHQPGVIAVRSRVESPAELSGEEVWYKGKRLADADTRGPLRDLWITSAVKRRLVDAAGVSARNVRVDTNAGTVVLFGTVPTAEARAAAESEARSVGAVTGVENEIEVTHAQGTSRAGP